MEDPLLATSTGRSCFYFYFILAYCCSPTRFFIAIRICPPTLSGVRVWPRLSQVGTLVSNLKGFWSRFSSFPLLLCWLTFRREDEEVLSKTRDSTSLFLSFFLSFFLFLFIDREDFLSRCRVVHLCIAIILPNCLEIGLRFFTYLLTYTVLSSRVAARKRKTEPSQDSKGNSVEGYRASCSYWSQVRFYYVAILSILVSCWGV